MGVLSGINTTNFPCTLNSVQRRLLLGSHLKHNCEMLVSTCPSPWVTDMRSCIMDTYLYRGITICKKKSQYNPSGKEYYNSQRQYYTIEVIF